MDGNEYCFNVGLHLIWIVDGGFASIFRVPWMNTSCIPPDYDDPVSHFLDHNHQHMHGLHQSSVEDCSLDMQLFLARADPIFIISLSMH